MNQLFDWLNQVLNLIGEDTSRSWVAIAIFAIILTSLIKLILKITSKNFRKLAAKTESAWDDIGVDLIDGLRSWVLFIWIFYSIVKSLQLGKLGHKALLISLVTASVFQIAIWGIYILKNWRNTILNKRVQEDPSSASVIAFLYNIIKMIFIITIVLIGLSNVGVNISALIAGLGVGGIAVALAAQNILGDLLASVSILLDKPFIIGDFIVAGNDKGTVEYIGIKTTRVRSLSGEQLVLSNKDLLESRIKNFKRMVERRTVLTFGVTYNTKAEKLEQIPIWIQDFVEGCDKLRFDRCHFFDYGASSLDFELVFYVLDSDYNTYMGLRQKLLLDIFRKFAAEGVEFAFPTQSLYIEKVPSLEMAK